MQCPYLGPYGAGFADATTLSKDHFRRAPSTSTRLRRLCHDGQMMAHLKIYLERLNSDPLEHRSGRSAPIRALSPRHAARQSTWTDGCASMPGSPRKLPMQELARNINYWSVGISHVHWACQFKLSRSRQYMLLHLGDA